MAYMLIKYVECSSHDYVLKLRLKKGAHAPT